MKMIVIGTGFIGNHLIKKLQELKHEVTVFHHNDKIEIKEADYIFYVAGYGNHFNQKDESLTVKANVIDYLALLRATKDVHYKGLFYFSTSSVTLPVQTAYSDSKFMGEVLGKRFHKKYGKPIISVRPYSVYGAGEAPFRFIPTVIKHLKDGKSMPLAKGNHDWIHAEDFVEAVVKIMERSIDMAGKSIGIGTGVQTSNHEVVKILEKISGKKLKTEEAPQMRSYDNTNWVADITILKSLGWKPSYTLEKGLKRVWENYKEE